jgi:hypothetical protein
MFHRDRAPSSVDIYLSTFGMSFMSSSAGRHRVVHFMKAKLKQLNAGDGRRKEVLIDDPEM